MKPSLLSGGLLATLALVLAGCSGTGNFDVQQTEPFRVQLEGEPQTVVVSEDDDEPQQVVVATCNDPCNDDERPEKVNVKVQVTPAQASACVLKVIIKARDTGAVLVEREIRTGGSGSTSTMTETETQTVTQTETQTATQTVTQDSGGDINVHIEDILVDVRGNNNIVVLTQAIQGSADVDISAVKASGNAEVELDDEDDGSATMTTTASATNSTSSSGSPTGTPP